MNAPKILMELKRERQLIDDVIAAIERLLAGKPRRGRPRKALVAQSAGAQ